MRLIGRGRSPKIVVFSASRGAQTQAVGESEPCKILQHGARRCVCLFVCSLSRIIEGDLKDILRAARESSSRMRAARTQSSRFEKSSASALLIVCRCARTSPIPTNDYDLGTNDASSDRGERTTRSPVSCARLYKIFKTYDYNSCPIHLRESESNRNCRLVHAAAFASVASPWRVERRQ